MSSNLHPISSLLVVSLSAMLLLPGQTQAAPVPSEPPPNCPALEPGNPPPPASVRTAETISQTGLTLPSLWWADEQFGGQVLNNWCAYPAERRVDLVVNRQAWTLLTYLERYEFVHHFGSVARDFQYELRVFNPQKTLLAAYTCDYSVTPTRCDLWMDSFSGEGVQNPLLQSP